MTRGQNFETMCGKDEWTAIPSAAALRAAVFALSAKNLRGGGGNQPPPGCARVKLNWILFLFVCYETAQLISRDTFNLTSAYHPHAFWARLYLTSVYHPHAFWGFWVNGGRFSFLLRTSWLPALGPPQRKPRQMKCIFPMPVGNIYFQYWIFVSCIQILHRLNF